jgi:hypothetical protein
MLKAHFALGKFWCGGHPRIPIELPSPVLEPDLERADGLAVMDLTGWDFNAAGELFRVGKHHHTLEYRKDRRARGNTRLAEAGMNMKIWDPAESLGRRAIRLPVVARCPKCDAPNVLDADLIAMVRSPKQPK